MSWEDAESVRCSKVLCIAGPDQETSRHWPNQKNRQPEGIENILTFISDGDFLMCFDIQCFWNLWSINWGRLEQMMLKSTNGSKESTGKTSTTGSVISTTPHPYILLSQNTGSPQFHLIILQKIEAATGAKVEIRGRHVQLRRLPWGRPEQSCRGQWKGAEDLWWLLITSSLGTVCGQTFFLWKHEDLPKWADITGACINVISIWPTSSQQIYFSSYSKCIFTSYANIFLNVLQIYFCKIFLSIICAAPQLKNLKYEQYKIWINDTSLV